MDFADAGAVATILSSCSLARKNLSSSRCIWRTPRRNEVSFDQVSVVDAVSSAIQASASAFNATDVEAEWNVFRPDDLLFLTPPEYLVDSVGHLSGAANDILNNGFLWYLWSLVGHAK
jgi:hypothetical protein